MKILFYNKKALPLAAALMLALLSFAYAAGDGGMVRPPRNYKYYFEKALAYQKEDLSRAHLYADSMLMAAGAASDSLGVAEAMKLTGDLHDRTGDYAKAIVWFHRALATANEHGDRSLAVRIHNNLGGVYLKTANYDKALSQYNMAYSLGRAHLTPIQSATLLNNLGVIYRYLKQYEQSKVYLLEALDLYEKLDNTQGVSQAWNNLGILAHEKGDYQEARECYTRALELNEQIQRSTGVAYAYSNLASLYLDENKPAQALPYLYKAHKIKQEVDDKLGLLNTHNFLGQAWIYLGKADSAVYHYKVASYYADSVQNINKKIEALVGLADAMESMGKEVERSAIFSRILTLKDSSFNQERAAQLAIAQAELEMSQKERAILKLTAEAEEATDKLRTREFVLLFSVLLVLLFALFTIFYIRRFRSERKAHQQLYLRHEEIRKQKEKIEQQHQTIQQQNEELQDANKLIEHYNSELQLVNEQLEDKIRERTRALTDTYRKLSFHINNTPLAVLEWNKELALVRWPDQAEKIFGFKAQQVLGKTAEELPFMQDPKHLLFLEKIRKSHSGLQTQQHNFLQEFKQPYGDPLYVEWSHSVLSNDEGGVESLLSIANDVSLRENAYHETSQINQELDTFIYKASHDLRGPIARMQGIINLGKIESQDPKAHFYFDLLSRVSNELHNLLMRLLMVHNIHQHLMCMETINFRDFVEETIRDLSSKQHAAAFTFNNKIPENLFIDSDKNLLNIILVNLLDNSLTFADNVNPYIVISAKVLAGNRLHFSVQDNGPGIAENLHEKVFDMFFQGSTKSTGMGLGLYMVRKAVRKLTGDVKLEKRDQLTTFTVILPESEMMRIHPVPEPKKVTLA